MTSTRPAQTVQRNHVLSSQRQLLRPVLVCMALLGGLFALFGARIQADASAIATDAAVAPVTLAFSPTLTTVTVGEQFTVAVVVRTITTVDGAAVHVHFDPSALQVTGITAGAALPHLLQSTFDNLHGEISFAAGKLEAPFPAHDFELASITFVATNATVYTPLGFSAASPQNSDVTFAGVSILEATEDGAVAIEPPATPKPSDTPTPPPTFTPTPSDTPTTAPTFTPAPGTPTVTPTSLPTAESLALNRIDPNQGIEGIPNRVTIYGAGLRQDTVITVNGVVLQAYSLASTLGTIAYAVVPAGLAPGLYAATAVNPGGAQFTLDNACSVIDASRLDLSVTDGDLWFDPLPARQGRPLTVGVNVHRSGGEQTLLDVEVAFYRDSVTPANLLGAAVLPPLEPGVDIVDSAFIVWTPTAPGDYTLLAVIDPANRIAEGSETNNVARWAVTVLPPAQASDTTPPTVDSVTIEGGAQWTNIPTATLTIDASDNTGVTSLYLVERIYNNAARQWTAIQQSGWIPFNSPHTLALSPVGGARYIQAWVADATGNVSTQSQRSLINYLLDRDALWQGQVRIYRVFLQEGDTLFATVIPAEGDADLYVWDEAGVLVGYSDNLDLTPDEVPLVAAKDGNYQLEVHGYRDSVYTLALAAGVQAAQHTLQTPLSKPLPTAPVVAPASAPPGQQALPIPPTVVGWQLFLPLTVR